MNALKVLSVIITIFTAIVAFLMDIDNGNKTTAISHTVEQVERGVSIIADNLQELISRIHLTQAHADEFPGDYDYPAYLNTDKAQEDLDKINQLSNTSTLAKDKALVEIENLLLDIESNYKTLVNDYPISKRERVKVRGNVLSHRRQMGVLVAALRQMEPPKKYLELANRIEQQLRKTSS